jgi:hypothetical protein
MVKLTRRHAAVPLRPSSTRAKATDTKAVSIRAALRRAPHRISSAGTSMPTSAPALNIGTVDAALGQCPVCR